MSEANYDSMRRSSWASGFYMKKDGPIPLEIKDGKVTKWICRCGKSLKLPECDWTCAKK